MEEIDSLKSRRTTIKRKVKFTSDQLINAINNGGDIDTCYTNLSKTYEDFCLCHEDYCELVSSDTQFDSYKTVSGLDLEQYSQSVYETYIQAYASYNRCHALRAAEQSDHKAQLALNTAKVAIAKLEATINENQCNVNPVVDFSKDALTKCKESFLTSISSTCKSDIGDIIVRLENLILEVRCKVSASFSTSEGVAHGGISGREQTQNYGEVRVDQSNLETSRVSSPSGPAAAAVEGGTVLHASERDAKDLEFSIVSVFNNKTRHSVQPFSSTFVNANRVDNPHVSSLNDRHNHSLVSKRSRFKDAPIPSFDGDRHRWVEFRTVWLRYGESEYDNDIDRAYALKQSLKNEALDVVKAITADQPNAYNHMWHRLNLVYSDISQGVLYATNQLEKLKAVREGDYISLVRLVNDVEVVYSQLGQLDQLSSITLPIVDNLADLLPPSVKRDWLKTHRKLPYDDQIHPFPEFMHFLEEERNTAYRESGRKSLKFSQLQESKKSSNKSFHGDSVNAYESDCEITSSSTFHCVIHKDVGHMTADCPDFVKLDRLSRIDILRKERLCFRCFGKHARKFCRIEDQCSLCGLTNHHVLMCRLENENKISESNHLTFVQRNTIHSPHSSLFAIHDVPCAGSTQLATLFYDGGSSTSYVLNSSLDKLRAVRIKPVSLRITTLGGSVEDYKTYSYRIRLKATDGTICSVEAYGLDSITGPVAQLDMKVIRKLFPYFNTELLRRKQLQVDILLGVDQFGMHPKKELAKCGEDLSVLEGKFGVCIQGTHPLLKGDTKKSTHIQAVVNLSETETHSRNKRCHDLLMQPSVTPFIDGEKTGIEVIPKCGTGKCGKCPTVSHAYSFQEQQELDITRSNLTYDATGQRWITQYPWIKDPAFLPDSYYSALATLRNTKGTLRKDIVDRNVARKLSREEMKTWSSLVVDVYHLAAMFKEAYPQVAKLLTHSTYVDDIVDSVPDLFQALTLASETNAVLTYN